MTDYEYEGVRRVVYEGAQFIPVCPHCGRFVRADETITVREADGGVVPGPNATCKKCGRVEMLFEGYY
jgi:hypothetical protein